MGEEDPASITDLADEYLGSLDEGEEAEGDAEEVREELEYWEQQVEEFEDGTAMHEMAKEERDEWREKLEAIEALGERRKDLRTELLTRASTEFAPNGDWLDTPVIRALSHALHGQQNGRLFIGEYCLPEDQEEMSKRDMVTAAKTVHTLARDSLGDEDEVAEIWDALDTDTRLSIAQVLAGHREPMSSGQISDELGEDSPNDPGANIRDLRGRLDMEPFHGSDRGYTLTLAGRYVMKRYGPGLDQAEDEADTHAETEVSESDTSAETSEELDVDSTTDREESEKEVDLSTFDIRN